MTTIDARVRLPFSMYPEDRTLGPEYERYAAVFTPDREGNDSLDDLLAGMKDAGVERAVVHAEHEFGDIADQLTALVAEVVASDPSRLAGFGSASLGSGDAGRMMRQVTRASELGLQGINIQPAFFGMAIHDRRLYPLYARAEELRMPVAVHTGVNYMRHARLENEHPLQLDAVACDFPELVLIAAHSGWPWVAEMVAVARRHPTVHLEFGGMAPKYLAVPGSGWEVFMRFASLLRDQVLFGTDWPLMTQRRVVGEWEAIDLKPEVRAGLMGANAARLVRFAEP